MRFTCLSVVQKYRTCFSSFTRLVFPSSVLLFHHAVHLSKCCLKTQNVFLINAYLALLLSQNAEHVSLLPPDWFFSSSVLLFHHAVDLSKCCLKLQNRFLFFPSDCFFLPRYIYSINLSKCCHENKYTPPTRRWCFSVSSNWCLFFGTVIPSAVILSFCCPSIQKMFLLFHPIGVSSLRTMSDQFPQHGS